MHLHRFLLLSSVVSLGVVAAACTPGTEPPPREFEVAGDEERGGFDRLLLGPGVGAGRLFVDRIVLNAGESLFETPQVTLGTLTVFVLDGAVELTASEMEATLETDEVATFAAGLEHQVTATTAGPATVILHRSYPSERRTDGE